MEKLILIILGLASLGLCEEEPVQLFATSEPQNLTSPDMNGITGPKDFKWRIWQNVTGHHYLYGSAVTVTLNYLNITESVNCTESYLEVITDNYTNGQLCGDEITVESYHASGSYLDIILHVGSETGTPDFHLSYHQEEMIICIYPYKPTKRFRYCVLIVTPIVIVIVSITTFLCLRRRCRKHRSDKEKEANGTIKEKPSVPAVFTGPPSYDDVTKSPSQPPPYTSVALA